MIKKLQESDILQFKDISPEEKERRGILGVLYGPMADIVKSTRNGRKYSEQLWEKVFEDDIVKEMLKNGGIPGELDHPADRTETCSEKIAIMMPEAPKKDDQGHLVGRFDIIDTPCGKIAYALAKYGFQFGISSRGEGDVEEDFDGNESVDPDTYNFQAFDLVLLPAVKDARLKMVESLDKNKVQLKKALNEALENASTSDKKIMTEALDNLNIDYKPEMVDNKINESLEPEQSEEASDTGSNEIVKDLQEALRSKKALEDKVAELQEKLSVCYTKELKYQEDLGKYKQSVITLSESAKTAKALKSQVTSLQEQLKQKDILLDNQSKQISSLKEQRITSVNEGKVLNESLKTRDTKIKSLTEQINTMRSDLKKQQVEAQKEQDKLRESLEDLKKDSSIKKNEYNQKIAKSNSLVEKYRNIAKQAVDKYISSKATMLGISSNDIKRKLSENYSFEDIDRICEDLQEYRLNINKLPFNFDTNTSSVKMKVKESKEPIKPISGYEDEVDEDLIRLANLN